MKKAFTLIELVVVLALIAIVTHLATRELVRFGDRRLAENADRVFTDLRAACTAFYGDTGRLLRADDGTLSELWTQPTNVTKYALQSVDFHGTNIVIACGWRGPYYRLPTGKRRLSDVWGNAIEYHADDEARRLVVSNSFAIAAAHLGPSALLKDRREFSLLPEGGATARLAVNIANESGVTGYARIGVLGPRNGQPAILAETLVPLDGDAQVVFPNLIPGPRTLVVIAPSSRLIRLIDIQGGDNLLQIIL